MEYERTRLVGRIPKKRTAAVAIVYVRALWDNIGKVRQG
jgi:hypothetical protein